MLRLQTHAKARVRHLAFTPDGRTLLAAAERFRTVWRWELPSGRPLTPFEGHRGDVSALACGVNGLAASLDRVGQLFVWETDSGRTRFSRAGLWGGSSVALSPDGRTVAVGSFSWWLGSHAELLRYDTINGVALRVLSGHRTTITSVAYAPDGLRIATGSRDRTVRLWDAVSGAERPGFVGRLTDWLRRWRGGASEQQRAELAEEREIRALAFAPNGQLLAAATGWGATVWDAVEGGIVADIRGHRALVDAVAFHPDGRTLATAGRDGAVKYWDVSALAEGDVVERASFAWDVGKTYSLAFASDGTRAAAGGDGGQVVLWDADQ